MYYLEDMFRAGCVFVMRNLLYRKGSKMVVSGDLYVGDKEYIGKAVIYSNGRPAKLLDVLGENPADAKKNLAEVMFFMSARYEENTNGIASNAVDRLICKMVWILAMIATCGSAFVAGTNYFMGKQEFSGAFLTFIVLSMVCAASPGFIRLLKKRHINDG